MLRNGPPMFYPVNYDTFSDRFLTTYLRDIGFESQVIHSLLYE